MAQRASGPIASLFSAPRVSVSHPQVGRFLACFSAKGGAGVSVLSSLLAAHLAQAGRDVLLVDLAGDLDVIFGLDSPPRPGVSDWLQLEHEPSLAALDRLESSLAPGLSLLSRGAASLGGSSRLAELLGHLGAQGRAVIVDCGNVLGERGVPVEHQPEVLARRLVAGAARTRWLVTRECYLGVKAASRLTVDVNGVVLVTEPGRMLRVPDVEGGLQAPVVLSLMLDQAVFRAVDSGALLGRPPRGLGKVFDQAWKVVV